MEYTPKKQPLSTVNASSLRHNPYASGGGQFIRKYRQHRYTTCLVTPSKTNIRRKFSTRTDKILSASKTRSVPEKNSNVRTPARLKKSPQAPKRSFHAINGLNSSDPYKVFTDSEDENKPSPRKETKRHSITKDKENLFESTESSEDDIFTPTLPPDEARKLFMQSVRADSVKVYSNKRKPLVVTNSRLVGDISPAKVEKAYGPKSLFLAEKENIPTQVVAESSTSSQVLLPHMIGFPNYGNTCYLNSVLQSLLGLPTFLCDYRQITSELGLNHKSLFYGLGQVLYNRMKGQVSGVKLSLRTVKENLERIDGSFSGFKMQDANEFLTKVLDTIKDEIDRCYASRSRSDSYETQESLACNSSEEVDEDVYLSGARVKHTPVSDSVASTSKAGFGNEASGSEIEVGKSGAVQRRTDQQQGTTARKDSVSERSVKKYSADKIPVNILRNPVKDNFEFQLLESYRCLGCNEVDGRKQTYFSLYVNLPDNGGHTIQDAIAGYMGIDERELTCAHCGHDASSVVTSITSLPRILIIQLKRYEFKPEQCESFKMSSNVLVNQWITLDGFMTEDVAGPSHWNPEGKNSLQTPQNPHQPTLTARNLSSEMNKCDAKVHEEEVQLPPLSPSKPSNGISSSAADDDEEEELQLVMRRSMEEDTQYVQEEEEIQQAIRLSLQEMGMSYSQENQGENSLEQSDEKEQCVAVKENKESGQHAYCLISIISHFGLTTNTGHYVSDVYNCEEESWFHYDDESVAEISESVVFAEGRQKNGYIFFYMHKDLFQKVKNKDKR